MSMAAYRWAKTWNGLSSNQKFVLVMICDHYNEDEKRAWPTIGLLARETGMSDRTVTRCLRELERIGLVETEKWLKASTNERDSNRYYLPWYDAASTKRPGFIRSSGEFDHEGVFQREEVDA